MVKRVHTSLEQRGLLPAEHLVDKGYTDSQVLVESQRTYGVTLIGPVADDPSWQARAGTGFDKSQFLVDWDRKVVTCPMGKQSISWLPNTYKNGMTWEVRFARKDCPPCLHRAQCTRAKKEPRLLGLQEREQYEALQAARQRQTTRSLPASVCPSGRHREHPRAGDSPVWPPAIALYWARQDPFAASGDGRSPELCAAWGMVGRDAAGEDPLLPLCCPKGSIGIRHQCQHSCHQPQNSHALCTERVAKLLLQVMEAEASLSPLYRSRFLWFFLTAYPLFPHLSAWPRSRINLFRL